MLAICIPLSIFDYFIYHYVKYLIKQEVGRSKNFSKCINLKPFSFKILLCGVVFCLIISSFRFAVAVKNVSYELYVSFQNTPWILKYIFTSLKLYVSEIMHHSCFFKVFAVHRYYSNTIVLQDLYIYWLCQVRGRKK